MSGDVDLEAELDRLYQLPVGDFVGERNELVKRLKGAGELEAASTVKRLGRPSVSAWAVNRLWQIAPEPFAALRRAGVRLRGAQQSGLGPAALQAALAERRGAVGELLGQAESLLGEAGHAASTGTLLRISKTLEAIAAYGDELPEPPPGRLAGDLEPPGIEALTRFGVAAVGARRSPKSRPAVAAPKGVSGDKPRRARKPTPHQLEGARERMTEARRQAAEAKRKAKAAATQVARATDREAAARSTLETVERQAEAARQKLKAARLTLEEKRQSAREAEQTERLARRALAEAEQHLAELEERL